MALNIPRPRQLPKVRVPQPRDFTQEIIDVRGSSPIAKGIEELGNVAGTAIDAIEQRREKQRKRELAASLAQELNLDPSSQSIINTAASQNPEEVVRVLQDFAVKRAARTPLQRKQETLQTKKVEAELPEVSTRAKTKTKQQILTSQKTQAEIDNIRSLIQNREREFLLQLQKAGKSNKDIDPNGVLLKEIQKNMAEELKKEGVVRPGTRELAEKFGYEFEKDKAGFIPKFLSFLPLGVTPTKRGKVKSLRGKQSILSPKNPTININRPLNEMTEEELLQARKEAEKRAK